MVSGPSHHVVGPHTRLDRTVTIKTILPELLDHKQASERFFREAKALAGLNHPNILTLHDYCQDGDLHYLVVEHGVQLYLRQVLAKKDLLRT